VIVRLSGTELVKENIWGRGVEHMPDKPHGFDVKLNTELIT
jgi:hypothetical protein